MPEIKTSLNISISFTGEEAEKVKKEIEQLKATYREIFVAGLKTLLNKK